MNFGRKALVGVVGSALMATGAMAADMPPMVAPVAPPPVVAPPAPVFDWAGLYVGAYGGGFFDGLNLGDIDFWLLGGQVGYNFALGPRFIAGVEARAGVGIDGGVIFEGALSARLGAVLGDRVLVYGELGVESLAFTNLLWNVGGGIEIAVGQSMSIFAEGALLGEFGGGCCGMVLTTGVNFHIGQ